MANYSLDIAAIPATENYTNDDLTVYSASAAIRNGELQPKTKPGETVVTHKAALGATGNIEASIVMGASNAAFSANFIGVGLFDKSTYNQIVIRARFSEVRLYSRTAGGAVTSIGDFSNISYAVGDLLTFKFNRDLATPRLQSFLNGVLVKSVDSPITDISNYRAGFFVRHSDQGQSDGVRGFEATNLVIESASSIQLVGSDNATKQYEKNVQVVVDGLSTANLGAVSFAGVTVTPSIVNATTFTYNAPADIATGSYLLSATFTGTPYVKLVNHFQTHPIKLPDAGAAVSVDSIAAQFGNPRNGRFITLVKPFGLSWKSPYTGFDADNIILAVSDLFTAPSGSAPNTNYTGSASLIDDTGIVKDFTISYVVKDPDNPNAFTLVIKPVYQPIYDQVAD